MCEVIDPWIPYTSLDVIDSGLLIKLLSLQHRTRTSKAGSPLKTASVYTMLYIYVILLLSMRNFSGICMPGLYPCFLAFFLTSHSA